MTLLEIFERDIERLGGPRAAYYIIKAENSKTSIYDAKLKKYFRESRRRRKDFWKESEVEKLKINMHVPSKALSKTLFKNRSTSAIDNKKYLLRKKTA